MSDKKSPVDKLIEKISDKIVVFNPPDTNQAFSDAIELIESVRDTLEPKPLRFKASQWDAPGYYGLIDDNDCYVPLFPWTTKKKATEFADILGHPCVFVGEE